MEIPIIHTAAPCSLYTSGPPKLPLHAAALPGTFVFELIQHFDVIDAWEKQLVTRFMKIINFLQKNLVNCVTNFTCIVPLQNISRWHHLQFFTHYLHYH